MYRYLVLLGLCSALTVGVLTPVGARAARGDVATLKRIASKVDGRAGVSRSQRSAIVDFALC